MLDDYNQFEQRKQDHIKFALMPGNQAVEHNFFDAICLAHEALPEVDFGDITLASTRFGQAVVKPFLVSSMTAGHQDATAINYRLIEACALNGWVMGVGSQRRELSDNNAAVIWQKIRTSFPDVCLFSNIGITQILTAPTIAIQRLIDALNAQALIVHCNPLQEVIQPEGTPQFKGSWQALSNLINQLGVPVIIKETGCGFSLATLKRLHNMGIAAVDISGLGGTHWGRIEGLRAQHSKHHETAITFKNWGINTLKSVEYAMSIKPDFEVWGSGGVRHGLDAAKLLALGVTTVGFAKPLLEAALISTEAVYQRMQIIEYELQVAMFCTGSRCISDLKEKLCQ